MKRYALLCTCSSGNTMFIEEDSKGNPFTDELSATYYAKGIKGHSVFLITMSKEKKRLKT